MKRKKHHGHYCKICGEYRANEKFSGKGHKSHICKDCMKLPVEKRNELQTVNKILNLPFYLSREQRGWLEKKRKDSREEVRETAEWAYRMRFPHSPSPGFSDSSNTDPLDTELWLEEEIDPDLLDEYLYFDPDLLFDGDPTYRLDDDVGRLFEDEDDIDDFDLPF